MGEKASEGTRTEVVLSCVEQPNVQRALDTAKLVWDRAGTAWESITWIICRDPEAGEPLTESGFVRSFEFVGARSVGMPTIVVVYEISVFEIIIHDAKFSEAKYSNAGQG